MKTPSRTLPITVALILITAGAPNVHCMSGSLTTRLLRFYRDIRRPRACTMAWRCSGNSNADLVHNLKSARIFTSPRVEEAMLAVDRADFAPHLPYQDSPQGIGWNATISAPHMHAHALQNLSDHLKPGARVLDVGSGSGYLVAAFAKMVGPTGKVVGIDHIEELVNQSRLNIAKHHKDLLSSGQVILVTGDGRQGYEPEAPYDAIHVGAAAEKVPQQLIDQLAKGGRMLIPVGREHGNQVFLEVDKYNDGRIDQRVIEHVIYVPLTSKEHQLTGN